ncbi:DinB family protein [Mucilaginibacter sp. SMC90]|uniref:DinB family protein n=1 Tax=Mucilaginibacter sp. SMC90 TaxID=2929803 RepID=UPI001FB3E3B5|nr:DinB family protein [Mucilaginibacter sp. SMC90]UOE50846.1 DinB family protein [Mucilaginibacter sp. SMC90]
MGKIFKNLLDLRTSILQVTEGLTDKQLNEIPDGFNNNIAWNLGHVIATTQTVCYLRSNQAIVLDNLFVDQFKSGTRPETIVSRDEIEQIKTLLISNIEKLQDDYEKSVFVEYNSVVTRYGVQLNTIEEAIDFLQFHEGFHLGYILAIKRLVA